MRTIDGDALLEEIEEEIEAEKSFDNYDKGVTAGLRIAIKDIKKQPTIEAEPVKHGRWIDNGSNMWLCSYCKENLIYSETKINRAEKQRYCSRCGAIMDMGGDSDE